MNGKDSFIEAINSRGFNGEAIFEHYRDNGIGSFNSVGQFTVKHGAFLDDEILAKAEKQVD